MGLKDLILYLVFLRTSPSPKVAWMQAAVRECIRLGERDIQDTVEMLQVLGAVYQKPGHRPHVCFSFYYNITALFRGDMTRTEQRRNVLE